MADMEERELLLQSLKVYLEELRESGLDELAFAGPSLPEAPRRDAGGGEAAVASGPGLARPQGVAADAQGEKAAPTAADEPRHDMAAGASEREELCQGTGNPRARLLFVMTGAGFSGEAGDLLAKIIVAMKFATSEVYLLSFHPGSAGSGLPSRDELLRRIKAVAPEVVVTMGQESTQLLLESREPVAKLRGRFHNLEGIALMPTLHPDALLADQALKRDVWNDMQYVMRRLTPPS